MGRERLSTEHCYGTIGVMGGFSAGKQSEWSSPMVP